MKYFNFGDWVDDLIDRFGITPADINYGTIEYNVKAGNALVAYWDRQYKFGYISVE